MNENTEKNESKSEELKVKGMKDTNENVAEYFEYDPVRVEVTPEDDLSDWWRDKAQEELQEKIEWRDRDVRALERIVDESGLLQSSLPHDFLLRFLRAQKFDYDRAFTMLQRYFVMRKTWPDNFKKALPSLAKNIFKHQQQTVLPHRDRQGRRIFLFRAGIWDPSAVSPSDISAANYLLLEMIVREPKTQIAGLIMIVDMSGFGFGQVMHVTTDYVKSVANMIQNSFPMRFREIHIINESSLFHIVFSLIRPFLSERIRSRIILHGSCPDKLFETVDPRYLPSEFGGQADAMNNTDVIEQMKQLEEYYLRLQSYGLKENIGQNDLDDMPEDHPFAGYCMASNLN